MKSQLYLPEQTRKFMKSQITSYVEIYFEKLLPVFRDMEKDADKRADDFYKEVMNQPSCNEAFDPGAVADDACGIGVEYYSYLKLGKYHLTATWHAMLYQLWEQQVRLFLFREISRDIPRVKKLDFSIFCGDIKKIKKGFEDHKVDIERLTCWGRIDELRLLCHVIKHSDGPALKSLRAKNATLLKRGSVPADDMELYKTSLLEETLNIDEKTLVGYKEALLSFWEEIPERNQSEEVRGDQHRHKRSTQQ
jgi:hypothetical protein